MSINKFGSHILSRDNNQKLTKNGVPDKLVNVVDIHNVKLYYNIILPFIGSLNANKKMYKLLQDGRSKYIFPFETGTIIKVEYPKDHILLKINGNSIPYDERINLVRDDEISFHSFDGKSLDTFYGELVIKCPVEIGN